jgi:hypothetical protein
MLNPEMLKERVRAIESKRSVLVRLLEQPNLGILRIDVSQALDEIDDLLREFKQTFPEAGNAE